MAAPTDHKAPRPGSAFGLGEIWKKGAGLKQVSRWGMARHLSLQAFRNFWASPLSALLCFFTIGVVLFLLGAFLLLIDNLGAAAGAAQARLNMSIFLKDTADEKTGRELLAEVKGSPEAADAVYIGKADALREFRRALGAQAGLLDGLDEENPLPASITVSFREGRMQQKVFEDFAARFERNPAVERVQYNRGLVGQAAEVLRFFKWAGLAAAGLMLLIAGFIIASTIRLTLYSRRDEINIMQLVGATAWFVRWPCLMEGCLLGAAGGLLGTGLLYAGFNLLRGLLEGLELLRPAAAAMRFLPWYHLFLVLLAGICVGAAGSYAAARRFGDD